jgi:hypothetical protein
LLRDAQKHRRRHQDREQQNLQNVAFGEGADDRVRNNVEKEIDRRLVRRVRILGDRRRVWRYQGFLCDGVAGLSAAPLMLMGVAI